MSIPIKQQVIEPTVREVLTRSTQPDDVYELGDYMANLMKECESVARKKFKISPNQLGRLNGDWFEYLFKSVIQSQVGKENITVFPGRGHVIKEIKSFEDVDWIPMPDAIIKNPEDFRGVVSLKWGMRHDRMYQPAYEAYATKGLLAEKKLKLIKFFLLTNDNFSGYESRLKTMTRVPVVDGVFYLQHDRLPDYLKQKVKSFPDLINAIHSLCAD